MDNQGQSFNLDPNAASTTSPSQNTPANPLNTGNGAPAQEMPIEQLTPATPPIPSPTPIPSVVTPPITPPVTPAVAPSPSPSPAGPEKSGKKIIIYIIVAILFAAIGYGGYLFFTKGSDEEPETNIDTPPTIDIATPEEDSTSAKMEELEAVVEELRGVYGDNPVADEIAETEETSETTSPPSLTIEEATKVLR